MQIHAIRKIQEKYNTPGEYRILFATCSCKVVDRKEKKQFRNMKNKQEIQKKNVPKIQNNGYC